ncbi:hypothetical protein Corgl_0439 [Coriobacterium glomerans PW2]|uniref:Uncharacterized protein n=1 Tax=Coriobacterium glomerans (strain ATCC 49209 / DSM 20642 / JCM 10262 / PW2) TaxID=700015 RepID=F2N782_CORGP|nr:hypothetical protein [Coriobacterium glomerans]AEB06557.1 hypothetical protein Corgl_0439 [Coriobacterium glomerans PW2]
MGLFQKRDERDEVSGIEIIERSDVPGDLPESEVDIVEGASAEEISADQSTARTDATDEDAGSVEDADTDVASEPDAAEHPDDDSGRDSTGDGARDSRRDLGHEEPEPGTLDDVIPDDLDSCDALDAGDADADGSASRCEPRSHAASEGVGGSDFGSAAHRKRRRKITAFIAAAVLVVIVCGVALFALGGGFAPHGIRKPTFGEDQLATVVASYTYEGQHHVITARDAIEGQASVDMSKNEEGTYTTPSVESILDEVRSKILTDVASERGLSVSDNEMTDYAQTKIGVSDYSTIASRFKVSEDQAKKIVKDQALIQKLYAQVVGDSAAGASMPLPPDEPPGGKGDAASKGYADYIIKLLGKEWDAAKGTWADETGPLHAVLKDQHFTSDSATYDQAMAVYYVAYQQYSESNSKATSAWSDFQNDLFSKVDITFYGMCA